MTPANFLRSGCVLGGEGVGWEDAGSGVVLGFFWLVPLGALQTHPKKGKPGHVENDRNLWGYPPCQNLISKGVVRCGLSLASHP